MPDLPEDLHAAVNDQAQARVRSDIQGYARYLTPQAVDSLRGSYSGLPPRVSRYEIDSLEARGADYVVSVRYFVRDQSFVVRSRWHKDGDRWLVVHAQRLWTEGERRPSVLSRLGGLALRLLRRS